MRITTIYGDIFAERVIGNLINFKTFCEGCEPSCSECRQGYGSYVGDIMGLHYVDIPSTKMIEDPEKYIDEMNLPEADILFLVAIH
ncbi:MAG: thymidylate synthase, partial [Candidatus Hodarchaeota archaeon]